VVVVGAPADFMNDVPMGREGNLNKFSDGEGLVHTAVSEEFAQDLTTNFDPRLTGAIETAMALEWVHGMAQFADLSAEYINTDNGVIAPADLLIGIQAAIDTLT